MLQFSLTVPASETGVLAALVQPGAGGEGTTVTAGFAQLLAAQPAAAGAGNPPASSSNPAIATSTIEPAALAVAGMETGLVTGTTLPEVAAPPPASGKNLPLLQGLSLIRASTDAAPAGAADSAIESPPASPQLPIILHSQALRAAGHLVTQRKQGPAAGTSTETPAALPTSEPEQTGPADADPNAALPPAGTDIPPAAHFPATTASQVTTVVPSAQEKTTATAILPDRGITPALQGETPAPGTSPEQPGTTAAPSMRDERSAALRRDPAEARSAANAPKFLAASLAALTRDEPGAVAAPGASALPASAATVLATSAQPAPGQSAVPQAAPQPAAPGQAPIDLAQLVDNIARARAEAQPATGVGAVHFSLRHAEFGAVSLRFEHERSGDLTVAMTSSDPEFARAVAAVAPAERQTAADTGAPRSDTAPLRHGTDSGSGALAGESRNGQQRRSATETMPQPARNTHSEGKPRPSDSGIFA